MVKKFICQRCGTKFKDPSIKKFIIVKRKVCPSCNSENIKLLTENN
jgi:predicted Zn-ribbon and HTH transcriptional regulator